jgi:hypothetical protein
MSVRVVRFKPLLWLTIVTWAPGITAPLGSLMVPKTVASWVCDHAHAENKANSKAGSMRGPLGTHFSFARTLLIMTGVGSILFQTKAPSGRSKCRVVRSPASTDESNAVPLKELSRKPEVIAHLRSRQSHGRPLDGYCYGIFRPAVTTGLRVGMASPGRSNQFQIFGAPVGANRTRPRCAGNGIGFR